MNNLDSVFSPESMAVAGVGSDNTSWTVGTAFVETLLDFGFKGRLYPLNPKGGETLGLKIYRSLEDIPGPVDQVMSFIPAPRVPQLVKDCIAKQVKVLSLFTAGFSETGHQQGRELETEMYRLTHASGLRILGPNCMGAYCPKASLTFASGFPRESGKVAVICQSGGNTMHLVRAAARRGVRFSKVVSYGNGGDIDESELLEYLANDIETEIIVAYIEGVKDGRRFRQALDTVAASKPVIVLKGGVSEAGAGVAASHTGSLAGSDAVWEGMLRQSGAVRVRNLEELVDMMVTFLYMPLPRGRRVALFGFGGGASVLATDECIAAGLDVPPLPSQVQAELANLTGTQAGTILSNPVDLVGEGRYEILCRLADYDGIDLLTVQVPVGNYGVVRRPGRSVHYTSLDTILKVQGNAGRPMAVVIHWVDSDEDWRLASDYERKCSEVGLPIYHSITGMARAVDRLFRYYGDGPQYNRSGLRGA